MTRAVRQAMVKRRDNLDGLDMKLDVGGVDLLKPHVVRGGTSSGEIWFNERGKASSNSGHCHWSLLTTGGSTLRLDFLTQ